jgi:competence ComEA-like helix-hairpin-helix protein
MRGELLRRPEQVLLAVVVLLATLSIFAYWCLRIWHREDLIEFDKAPPLEAAFQVDINRAGWPEIMQLPGIGETTARTIVKVRETEGPFINLEDLEKRVHGIGPRMAAEIAPFLAPLQIPTCNGDDGRGR